MVLHIRRILIILLGMLPVREVSRIALIKAWRGNSAEKVHNVTQNDELGANKQVLEDGIDKSLEDGDQITPDRTETSVRKQLGVVSEPSGSRRSAPRAKGPRRVFSKTLEYARRAQGSSRMTILKAACDSSAFTCEEIMQLASIDGPLLGVYGYLWAHAVKVFAEGRNNDGCIADPANAKSILDSFESNFRSAGVKLLDNLKQVFIDNDGLKPAKGVGPPPLQLQAGLRTGNDMRELLLGMGELQLIKSSGLQGTMSLYEAGSLRVQEFEGWLKRIRSHGEQFSGSQLLALVDAIPKNLGTAQAISTLLQYLEQYSAGVTCEEVRQIIRRMNGGDIFFLLGLAALGSNIVDGQNKVDIVAFTDYIYPLTPQSWRPTPKEIIVRKTGELLQDIGVGLPPKNNPIFGVVKGNPVILMVDESTSMDEEFRLGDTIFTRRKFCNSQVETVLTGLPSGTYFNVIQYSSSAIRIFERPVLANKTNIDVAMRVMGATWRLAYAPGQDPVEMVRCITAFALNFQIRLHQNSQRNSMEAFQLAYASAELTSQQTANAQHASRDHATAVLSSQQTAPMPHAPRDHAARVTKESPQIYFLTSGLPDGGAHETLDNINQFDKGRRIPLNSIAFVMPADPVTKQFAKDLANKTGGFFRPIEQAPLHRRNSKREPPERKSLALGRSMAWSSRDAGRGRLLYHQA